MKRRTPPDDATLPLFDDDALPAADPAVTASDVASPSVDAEMAGPRDAADATPPPEATPAATLDPRLRGDDGVLDARLRVDDGESDPADTAADFDAESPADGLAAGLAAHVERWALRLGAPAPAARAAADAAAALSRATGAGHVCLTLDALADDDTEADTLAAVWRERLVASRVVGDAADPGVAPLVLDADGRLYLHRDFDHERALAARLKRAARPVPGALDAATHTRLAELFADNARAGVSPDWQRAAAALALRQRLAVISGGPGTGKTTTVVALLACLLAANPALRIALAAPTGKAAARMTEAIRNRAGQLPPELREKLPREAFTVHRLLRAGPSGFFHDATRPLAIDALIVDEASMLDLALARRLLDAVPDGARIVLLGDKDQLAAVESGAVFAELSADPALTPACRADLAAACGVPADALQPPRAGSAEPALPDAVVWFTRNFRFAADSGIGRLAAGINGGHADATLRWLRPDSDRPVDGLRPDSDRPVDGPSLPKGGVTGPARPAGPSLPKGGDTGPARAASLRQNADASVRWIADGGREPGAATWEAVAAGYEPFLAALRADPGDAAAVTAAFDRFRVLCATRDGARGVDAVNARVSALARRAAAAPVPAAGPWFAGRPVIVRRNDYVLKLFNGDIGIALPDANGELAVCFPEPGGFRRIAPARLPPHDSAFALTVHKSQGSEFEQVLLLLPERPSRVLTRELLYTGVTRAARRVALAGPASVIAAAIDSPTRRRSGLPARLRETPDSDA